MSKKTTAIHILVVEDTPIGVMVAQAMLEAAGCTSDIANTGEEAIQKLHSHYKLVLLDLGLPDYDGFDVARMIRNHIGEIASVPIIALTAHADDDKSRTLAKEIGINGLFSKPLSSALCEEIKHGLSSAKGKMDLWHLGKRV